MIPKIIHYCWLGKGKKPDYFYECYKTWRKYLPDYKIVEWNESNFDVNKMLYTKVMYDYHEYSFVSDVVRFYSLFVMGGIYFDIDVSLHKNMDDLLNIDNFFVFESDRDTYISSAIMGSIANSEYMQECYNAYKTLLVNDTSIGSGKLINTAAPEIIVDVLTNKGFVAQNSDQKIGNCMLHSKRLFGCQHNLNMPIYGVHLNKSSWSDRKNIKHCVIKTDSFTPKYVNIKLKNYDICIKSGFSSELKYVPIYTLMYLPNNQIKFYVISTKQNEQTIMKRLGVEDYIILDSLPEIMEV